VTLKRLYLQFEYIEPTTEFFFKFFPRDRKQFLHYANYSFNCNFVGDDKTRLSVFHLLNIHLAYVYRVIGF